MKKLTLQFVQEQFNLEGYILLSKEYINSYTKLDFICPNGHKHNIAWSEWNKGQRCAKCVHDALRLAFNYVKKSFEDEWYRLLSKKYINSRTKLDIICSKGHQGSMTFDSWKQGNSCASYKLYKDRLFSDQFDYYM